MLNKRNFWIAMFLWLFYCIISYAYSLYLYRGWDVSSTLNAASLFIGNTDTAPFCKYFLIMFPFVVILPFSFSYFEDKATETHTFYTTRIGKKNYILSKAIVCFCGSFLIIFIPFLLNMLLNQITYFENENTYDHVRFSAIYCKSFINDAPVNGSKMFLYPLYIKYQILYNIIYTFMISIFSGILGLFAFACSLKIKKYKILIFAPVYALFLLTKLAGEPFSYYGELLYFVMVERSNGLNVGLFFLFCVCLMAFSLISLRLEYSKEDL